MNRQLFTAHVTALSAIFPRGRMSGLLSTDVCSRESTTLGPVQKTVIRLLNERGNWFAGCGWVYQSRKRTQEVLETLVARGIVEQIEGVYSLEAK